MTIQSISTGIIGVLSLVVVGLLWRYPTYLFLALSVLSLMIVYIQPKEKRINSLILWITCGISGAIAEAIAISLGAWTYTVSSYLVPLWLPLLWGIASLFMVNLYNEINSLLEK